jgi:hypothetical protein
MKAAFSLAEAESRKHGNIPVVFCNWRTLWNDAIKTKCPEVDKWGGSNANCILIKETVMADDGHGLSQIYDWKAEGPLSATILSEQKGI